MNCKNCNLTIDISQNFCHNCGAKIIKNRLKPKVLVNQVNDEFLSVDNKLLKTFIHLFTKPEIVINGYINGTRKRYINVIQYFAIALTLLGLQVFFMESVLNDPKLYKLDFLEELSKLSSQKNNPFFKENNNFNSVQSLFLTVSIPISALATWLAYYITGIRRYNFTEHVVINLYYGAQATIVSAFTYITLLGFGINFFVIALFVFILFYIYFFFVLKRVFDTNFWETFVNFLLSVIILFVLSTLIMIVTTILIAIYN